MLAAAPAAPAFAATTGAGYSGITPYGGYLGNYIAPDGTRVYCIDSGLEWPSGSTNGGTVVGSFATSWGAVLSGTVIRKLNYAMLTWGQTADPTNAAAVSAYVYAYTSNFARTNGASRGVGLHYINGNAAVAAAYDVVWRQSEAAYAGPQDARARVSITMANSWDGSVTVRTVPASAMGTLTLDGAVVAGSRSTSIAVRDGSVIPIRGVPGDTAESYSIRATGSFSAAIGAQENIVLYSTGSQQRTIRGAYTGSISLSASDLVEDIPLRFSPVVGTAVASVLVADGASFIDTVTASVAAESAEWRSDSAGNHVPVIASGTLYGPFAQRPDVADHAPAEAPVVGTELLTLTGPGQYRSSGTLTAPSAGYYTWVWEIAAQTQTETTRPLLPAGYHFFDQFGLVAETHIVPMRVSAATQVAVSEVGFSGQVGDTLSVVLDEGLWLHDENGPLEAVFTGTAYFVPGATAPVPSATVPAHALVLATAVVVAPGPGIYESPTPATAPSAQEGFITWVWTLSGRDGLVDYFEPWSDLFGLPAETARVAPPTVATLAQATAAIGDEVHDTALVGGVIPAQPTALVFRAYLQPSGTVPTCDEATLVFDSSEHPVTVSAPGSYDSPTTRFTRYGTYFWVESLYSHDGSLIHAGECGLADETTLVTPGVVVTQAVERSVPGDRVHDTAMVSGLVPAGATLVFEAFGQHGVTDGPLCDASTLVFRSEAVPLAGAGLYPSPSTPLSRPGTYFWVETMLDRDGEPLHVGQCGVASETTIVEPPGLARTGVSIVTPLIVALGAFMLGIVLAAIAAKRGRREYR